MTTKKGGNKNDNLRGTNGEDILLGLGGNDRLDGGAGDDDLVGGTGNDRFIGRYDGFDNFEGGKGIDHLDYSGATDAVGLRLDFGTSGFTTKGSDFDFFRNIEAFTLSKNSDYFIVESEYSAQVFGGAGDDNLQSNGGVMRGDGGLDTLNGSAGKNDTFWLQRGKGADTIHNYAFEEDTFWLDGDDFDLGAVVGYKELRVKSGEHNAVGSNAQLIFDTETTDLYYDPDGTGSRIAELIATFPGSHWGPHPTNIEIV